MREVRRCYRAQYLQKLDEVTKTESMKEEELRLKEYEMRKERKQAFLGRLAEDRKRRAILKDRLRCEAKVTELLNMQRKSRMKKKQMQWLEKLQSQQLHSSNTDVNTKLLDLDSDDKGNLTSKPTSPDTNLLDRNVSVAHIMRQVGGAKDYPKMKTRRILNKRNVYREALEQSYDVVPEDTPTKEELRRLKRQALSSDSSSDLTNGQSMSLDLENLGDEHGFMNKRDRLKKLKQRGELEYGKFSEREKTIMLDQKIEMIKDSLKRKESAALGQHDHVQQVLLEQLMATRKAMAEAEVIRKHAEQIRASKDSSDGEAEEKVTESHIHKSVE